MGIFLSKKKKSPFFPPKEIIRDPEGRYILLSGWVNGTLYTYYALNRNQAKFFTFRLETLTPFVGTIVMGGDSNEALDQMLDKSGNGHYRMLRPPKQSLNIANTLHTHGLVDIWRELNPRTTPTTQHTLVRIDHIFATASTIPPGN